MALIVDWDGLVVMALIVDWDGLPGCCDV